MREEEYRTLTHRVKVEFMEETWVEVEVEEDSAYTDHQLRQMACEQVMDSRRENFEWESMGLEGREVERGTEVKTEVVSYPVRVATPEVHPDVHSPPLHDADEDGA